MEVILNAFPCVDSFFLIGATLVSYITLTQLDRTGGGKIKLWAMFYIHRYVRLTGVYAIIIALHATLLKFAVGGPQSHLVSALVSMVSPLVSPTLVP